MTFGGAIYNMFIGPLELFFEVVFTLAFRLVHNQGLSIICLSLAMNFLVLPLYAQADKMQAKQRDIEVKLQPGVKHIKKMFKGDEQYMILSTFYKQNHYHPLMALRSSFGLLIQVPFFIAAYNFLSNLESLNGRSFYFIRDMGRPDSFFSIHGFSVNLLPIAMTLINIIAGAIYTKGFKFKDKAQIYGMALLFLVILYNSPSGLVLYWTMNNIFSLVKNIFYKLKNPLKSFYIFCCTISILILIYFLLIYHTKFANKIIVLLFCSIIFSVPLIIKAINLSLNKTLKYGLDNKITRNSLFLLSCLVLFILSGITIPSALISSSPVEFSNIGSHSTPFFLIKNKFDWFNTFNSYFCFI